MKGFAKFFILNLFGVLAASVKWKAYPKSLVKSLLTSRPKVRACLLFFRTRAKKGQKRAKYLKIWAKINKL